MEDASFLNVSSKMGWYHNSPFARFRFRVFLATSFLLVCLIYLLSPTVPTEGEQQQLPLELSKPEQPEQPAICADRFGLAYLRAFTETLTSYCDINSTANLTCFSNKASDTRTDSFCIGRPALLHPTTKEYGLDCRLRDWDDKDRVRNIPQLNQFPSYWYGTGPHAIFNQYINFGGSSESLISQSDAKGFSFLVRREDNNQNLWHTMMEIMSLTMSLDVLRASMDPYTGRPFFTDNDPEQSQVIFLDNLADGPFYDLWRIFAKKPIVRIDDVAAGDVSPTKIVIPLPGGSNTFWQGDWEDIPCRESELLETFSLRVLDFYQVPHKPPRSSSEPLTLTLIDRKKKRRLIGQADYFEKLQARFPEVKMQVVDFATLPFSEQLKLAHSTDILLSVHGAGLTHGIFLRPNSTVVEILPPTLMHKGFKNMSKFLGHRYFSRHGSPHESPENNGDWQHDDVFIEEDRFFEMMEEAISSVTG